MSTKRAHVWISNAAATKLTGVKRVCLVCKQTNVTAAKECPGACVAPEQRGES
jgi:hypothetical protein